MAVCPSIRSQPRGSIMMSGKSRFCLSLMVGVACLHPVAAAAQLQDRQSFDLPAQDLGDALRKVAEQAGIELYASSADLAGRTTRPLKGRLEEHTSELQSLMRSSYAVFCLKKK